MLRDDLGEYCGTPREEFSIVYVGSHVSLVVSFFVQTAPVSSR